MIVSKVTNLRKQSVVFILKIADHKEKKSPLNKNSNNKSIFTFHLKSKAHYFFKSGTINFFILDTTIIIKFQL